MKARSFSMLAVLVLGVAALAVACGTDEPTPTPSPPPAATGGDAAAPTDQEIFDARWAELIEKAQAEGVLQFMRTSSGERMAPVQTFADTFGLEWRGGPPSGSAGVDRLLAERDRGIYDVDIFNAGGGSMRRALSAEVMEPIDVDEYIFHPDAQDLSKWRFGEIPVVDPDSIGVLGWSFGVGVASEIYYNTNTVSAEEIASIDSYWDFLEPDMASRTAFRNLIASGPTGSRVRQWLIPELGQEFIEAVIRTAHAEGNLVGSAALSTVTGLAQGKWDFVLGGNENDYGPVVEAGLPVAQHFADISKVPVLEGGVIVELSVGSSKFGLVNNAPHPNTAQLFLNWWMTREGQMAFQVDPWGGDDDWISLRTDIPQGGIRDDLWAVAAPGKPLGNVLLPNSPEFNEAQDDSLAFGLAIHRELGIELD